MEKDADDSFAGGVARDVTVAYGGDGCHREIKGRYVQLLWSGALKSVNHYPRLFLIVIKVFAYKYPQAPYNMW